MLKPVHVDEVEGRRCACTVRRQLGGVGWVSGVRWRGRGVVEISSRGARLNMIRVPVTGGGRRPEIEFVRRWQKYMPLGNGRR